MTITKGKWDIWQNSAESFAIIVNDFYKGEMLIKDDAILAADAGNTFQETNKLPSELAEANKELLEALKKALTVLVKAEYTDGYDATVEAELVNILHKHESNA